MERKIKNNHFEFGMERNSNAMQLFFCLFERKSRGFQPLLLLNPKNACKNSNFLPLRSPGRNISYFVSPYSD